MGTMSDSPLLHTVPRAVVRLGLANERTLWRCVAAGQLSTVKIGRRTYVTEDACLRFVATLTAPATSVAS